MTSPSPDLATLVTATIHDVTENELVDAAIAAFQTWVPDWRPAEGQTEVMLLQAMAVIAGQTIYATNQMPEKVLGDLLAMNGVWRTPAVAATALIAIKADPSLPSERTLPAGTQFRAVVSPGVSYDFALEGPATFTTDALTQFGTARAVIAGDEPNGIPAGFDVDLLDGVSWIESAEIVNEVVGGVNVEAFTAFLTRGAARLRRHSTTLVTADHFAAAALDIPGVVRARTLNLYDPDEPGVPGDHPGNVTVAVSDGDGNAVPEPVADALLAYLTENAIAGLIVHIVAPTVNEGITHTIAIRVLPGYDPPTVAGLVQQKVAAFLSPARWPFDRFIYKNQLVGIASTVPGVERVVSVSPDMDIELVGLAPLPDHTVVVTVTP